jgi:branched-chain amino acid transport system ATP-binding protein
MAEPLLELRGVGKSFGGLACLSDLDLHVDEGEIVSVIGPNGAGKTTLFNVITGVYRRTKARSCSTARASSGSSRTRSRTAASRARSRRCACS